MSELSTRNRQLVEISTLGMVFPLAIGAGYLLGKWIDQWLGTYPWLTLICSGLGIAAAFVNLFRVSLKEDGSTPASDRDAAGDDGRNDRISG